MLLSYFLTFVIFSTQVVFHSSCNDRRTSTAKKEQAPSSMNQDSVYHFDTRHPTVREAFDPAVRDGSHKFIQIEVTRVKNPKLHPVSFEVFYQEPSQPRQMLGVFSLYPSDHPGKFIVPTQGKLKRPGVIILSLILPEALTETDTLEITTSKMKLTNS